MKNLPYSIKGGLLAVTLGLISLVTLVTGGNLVAGIAELPVWIILGDTSEMEAMLPYLTYVGLFMLFVIGFILGTLYGFIKPALSKRHI